ncbi:MAG: isoprenylcysteine carboxylmethyltransferase family protein [Gemmatimonadaceae bacterium]|nr:isoprenylcysteine carboxylmethyltransferase family protein [Gemmatimonadaceae bacterium]
MFVLIRALIYSALFLWLWAMLVPQWLGLVAPTPAAMGPAQYTGLVVGAAGLGLALWCVWNFARTGRGTPLPADAPRELVATGPYRYSRNPMYVGGTALIAGSAIYLRSWPFVLYAAGFFTLTFIIVVMYEEPHLRNVFGESYRAYKTATPRWIPRLGSR